MQQTQGLNQIPSSAMSTPVEFLESNLRSLQEMHRNIEQLPEKSVADIEQTSKKAEAVTKRCQQLVSDLAEARQEEQLLLNELNMLSERQRQRQFQD